MKSTFNVIVKPPEFRINSYLVFMLVVIAGAAGAVSAIIIVRKRGGALAKDSIKPQANLDTSSGQSQINERHADRSAQADRTDSLTSDNETLEIYQDNDIIPPSRDAALAAKREFDDALLILDSVMKIDPKIWDSLIDQKWVLDARKKPPDSREGSDD